MSYNVFKNRENTICYVLYPHLYEPEKVYCYFSTVVHYRSAFSHFVVNFFFTGIEHSCLMGLTQELTVLDRIQNTFHDLPQWEKT